MLVKDVKRGRMYENVEGAAGGGGGVAADGGVVVVVGGAGYVEYGNIEEWAKKTPYKLIPFIF